MTAAGPRCIMSRDGRHHPTAEANHRFARPCRDCGLDLYRVGALWEVPPAGEIIVGFVAEFERRVIEGDGYGTPIGIFGAGGSSAPRHSFVLLPPAPSIVS